MAGRTLRDGEDFSFPASFGFTGSAARNVSPRPHPTMNQNEFGDDASLAAASAAPPALARGGRPHMPKGAGKMGGKKVPAPNAAKAVLGALQLGKAIGQKTAGAGGMPGGGALSPPPAATAGMPTAAPPPAMGAIPGMRRGGKARRKADGGTVGSIDDKGDWDIPESDIAEHGKDYDRLNNGAFVRPPKSANGKPFGSNDEEFTTRTSGPLQKGHMNTKTGDTTFDGGKTVMPGKPIGKAKGGKAKRFADGGATNSKDFDDMPDAPYAPWDSQGNPLVGTRREDSVSVNKSTGKTTESRGKTEPMYGRQISEDEFNAKAKGGKVDKWAGKAFKPSHKGRLHKALHVPLDEKIPAAKMAAAKNSKNPHVRHMAAAARNINK